MTILVDASALVAMVVREPDAIALGARLDTYPERLYCAVGAWEATMAIARIRSVPLTEAHAVLCRFFSDLAIQPVPIGEQEARLAIAAHDRYGKGRQPARLNMGDCFAYACARANDAKLLYKGDDFALTDLA